MYHAACKVEFKPFTVVLTADVFQLLIKLLITILLFLVVKAIEDNSLCHPRFHRANTTNHAWCMVSYCRYVRIAPSIIYVRPLRISSSSRQQQQQHLDQKIKMNTYEAIHPPTMTSSRPKNQNEHVLRSISLQPLYLFSQTVARSTTITEASQSKGQK